MADLKFGLVLPHFGQHASVEKCLEGAIKAEAYGFDSVWVRDHLVFTPFTPYDTEGTDNTHIEGLLVLSARFRSSDWYQQIDLLGNEVGPAL
jgi:alkanesulfonate monooxygenase SsuD/methylene tetrahydromethanopterin reductase-like flavin-dependent oxidoreductase (luciferase family)